MDYTPMSITQITAFTTTDGATHVVGLNLCDGKVWSWNYETNEWVPYHA